MWLAFLACAPEAVDGPATLPTWETVEPEPAPSPEPEPETGTPALLPRPMPPPWPWPDEPAAGECSVYLDGALRTRTQLTPEGRPLIEDYGDFQRRWFRTFRQDGSVEALRVLDLREDHTYEWWSVAERYDAQGRVVASEFAEWHYDELGRVVLETDHGGEIETRYTYTPSGQLESSEHDGQQADLRFHSSSQYEWDGDVLLSQRHEDHESGYWRAVRWDRHHVTGLPEEGELTWSNHDGPGVATIEWRYDEQGRPLEYTSPWDHDVWTWDGDRIVAHEWTSLEPNPEGWTVGYREEWEWDGQGRPIAYSGYRDAVLTWDWDADGEIAGGTIGAAVWQAVGTCPNQFLAPPREVELYPWPVPRTPKPPAPWGEQRPSPWF